MATSPRWLTTSTVVVADDGAALVVDPALTCDDLDGLAAAVVDRGWRVVAGFATHPHFDHLLWAPALGAAPRFATATCLLTARRHAEELAHECATQAPGSPAPVVGGLTAVGHLAAVPWPGPAAVVLEHRAHAPGHAALWLPGPRVLLAGDMLSDTEVPLLDTSAADPVGDYRVALDQLAERVGRARAVVPGHGRLAGTAEAGRRLAADRAYLDALDQGRRPEDPRLADPEVRGEHERQVRLLSRHR